MKTKTIRIPRRLERDFDIEIGEREGDEGAELYPVSLSSEFPVKRYSWDGPYYEILSHEPDDVDLSRAVEGLPALKNHSARDQIGSVQGIKLDTAARRLRGFLAFSAIRLGQDQKTLVDEGHLKTSSIGYFIRGMTLESTDEDGVPTYRVSWAPAELSLAPIPADPTVGVGRSEQELIHRVAVEDLVEFVVADPAAEGGDERMDPKEKLAIRSDGSGTPPPAPAEDVRDYGAEAAEISELCAAHNRADKAAGYIREKVAPGLVAKMILDEIRTDGPAAPASEVLIAGMPAKDRDSYSYQRAIRILMGDCKADGLEAEIHTELARTSPASKGGVKVPWRIRGPEELVTRTLGTGEPSGGATLVDTQKLDMIDLLRSKTRVLEFGARFYPGLEGVVEFPKKTGAPTVYWMGENPAAAVAASEQAYGATTMSPKTIIGQIRYPRQLLVQASIDVEADVTNELALGHAKMFDLAALHGLGSGGEPAGIYNAADVQSHTVGGVPDLTDTGTMTGLVADADADYGALRWMTTPLMASLLRRTVVVSGHPVFLWTGSIANGEVDGYGAGATTQVSKVLGAGSDEHGLIFGNWNELMLGVWGNDLELVIDEKTRAGFGQIVITSFSMADVGIRHPEAFVKGTGAKLS
jgi:HK97 family phage major capsid protein